MKTILQPGLGRWSDYSFTGKGPERGSDLRFYCICLYQDAIGTPPFEPESFSSNGEADNVEAHDKSNFGNRKDKKAEIM